jgi:cell division protein FtsL
MMRPQVLWSALLIVAVLSSGIGVVWEKNQSRALFVDLQKLRARHELASMEWGRLQLELANVGSLEDVMRIGSKRLHMHAPAPDRIVVVD